MARDIDELVAELKRDPGLRLAFEFPSHLSPEQERDMRFFAARVRRDQRRALLRMKLRLWGFRTRLVLMRLGRLVGFR
jgi:hypothetical protein